MRYRLKEVTPEAMRCPPFGGCPAIYEVADVTPASFDCGVGPCPGIYEARDVTPGAERFEGYIFVGPKVNPADAGLEKRVGEREGAVRLPREMVDKFVEERIAERGSSG